MAEIFGAVASGAGLASLAIQLVDSAQKLKALYNASKDAPATVAELCFELETMSLSLRQLDSHRNASITGDELLGRCYTTCIRMVGKIEDAVIKIERLIQRRRMVGRLYMAFKEPEIRELLEELERSKSSMSFAYMSYCHSWSLREAAKNHTLLTAQSNAISSQIMQLHDLENAVLAGNSMILDRLTVPTSAGTPPDTLASTSQRLQVKVRQTKKSPSHRKFRIALPRSFVDCVWEFGVRGTGNGWEFQLHPVNIRPRDAFVFKVVKSGRVPAVRALLDSGALSMQDRAVASDFDPCESLLDLAASYGHIELCNFLLEQYSYFCDDATMYSALHRFIECSRCDHFRNKSSDFRSTRQEADNMYLLFMDRYGLVIPSSEEEHHNVIFSENVESNMLLTENSLRHILDGQFTSNRRWVFELKFPIAVKSIGWPPDMFLEFLQPCDPAQLVTAIDGQSRTVLHWTAKHFGYWACTWNRRDACPDDTMVNSYATLLKKFISMGADIHAVNSQYETPLMTALHQFQTFNDWPTCALAIQRWGEILVEAGVILSHYIQVENPLLRSLAGKSRAWESGNGYMLFPHETQLLIVDNSILAAEIQFCRPVQVWERRTSPGAWDTEPRLPTRSIFGPQWGEDHSLFWHKVEKVEIYSKHYLVQETSRADTPFYSLKDMKENLRALFGGTQDDHGLVASTILRDRSRGEAKIPLLRDRASSVPPEATHRQYNRLPTILGSAVEAVLGLHRWIPIFYRCAIGSMRVWRLGTLASDGCWSEHNPRFFPSFHFRSAEERLQAEDDWEVQLLREQGGVDAVKRFAQRFCPDLRDQVEQELATSRSTLDLS